MIKLEFFDATKTYMFPNGEVASPDIIKAKFPAVDQFLHVLELNGPVVQAVMSFQALQNLYQIEPTLTAEEAMTEIEYKINNPPLPEPRAEERIAAALEFQNIMMLPDKGV